MATIGDSTTCPLVVVHGAPLRGRRGAPAGVPRRLPTSRGPAARCRAPAPPCRRHGLRARRRGRPRPARRRARSASESASGAVFSTATERRPGPATVRTGPRPAGFGSARRPRAGGGVGRYATRATRPPRRTRPWTAAARLGPQELVRRRRQFRCADASTVGRWVDGWSGPDPATPCVPGRWRPGRLRPRRRRPRRGSSCPSPVRRRPGAGAPAPAQDGDTEVEQPVRPFRTWPAGVLLVAPDQGDLGPHDGAVGDVVMDQRLGLRTSRELGVVGEEACGVGGSAEALQVHG